MAYIDQNFAQSDLTVYLQNFRPEAANYTIPITTIAGAINIAFLPVRRLARFSYICACLNTNSSMQGVEAAIDTQTAAGIIYPLPSGTLAASHYV